MKLITSNAEYGLYVLSQLLARQSSPWLCAHIKAESPEHKQNFVLGNMLYGLLCSEEGNIYLCNDGDIIILYQADAESVVKAKLQISLSEVLRLSQADMMDLQQDYARFTALCRAKLEQSNRETQDTLQRQESETLQREQEIHKAGVVLEPGLFQSVLAGRPQRKELSVLLAEGDAFTRKLLASMLPNVTIHEAGSGAAALQAYMRYAPDVVFLGASLNDISSRNVMQEMIRHDANAFVVMLTASTMDDNIIAALEDGAQGFITRPFAKAKLQQFLSGAAELKRLRVHACKYVFSSAPAQ